MSCNAGETDEEMRGELWDGRTWFDDFRSGGLGLTSFPFFAPFAFGRKYVDRPVLTDWREETVTLSMSLHEN